MQMLRRLGSAAAVILAMVSMLAVPTPAHAAVQYEISNVNSGLCLTVTPGAGERPVYGDRCRNVSEQRWFQVVERRGYYLLKNVATNLCLAIRGTGENPAIVTTCNEYWNDQVWYAYGVAPQINQYQNINSQLCMVQRGQTIGTRVIQSTCGRQWADQLWLAVAR
jgi:Ricin-type beta-trefoil lectin domain-like